MNPNKKGWFDKYVSLRTESLFEDYDRAGNLGDLEKSIYRWIQPSGIMYGHPIHVPFLTLKKWDQFSDKDRTKLIMAEGFLMGMYAIESDGEQLSEQIKVASRKVIQFYEHVFPHMKAGKSGFFGNPSESEIVEEFIDQRLKVQSSFRVNFWSRFFQNSLLFLDIYYFFRYLETQETISLPHLRNEIENIRFLIVHVIAAAAHSNNSIEKEERELFNFFLASSNLPPDKKAAARSIFQNGADIQKIQFPVKTSWLMKKYILELATLTIWSDKTLERSEREFLELLTKKLELEPEELEVSILSIEAFVLENWDQVHYLQSKGNYQLVGEQMVQSMKVILKKNSASVGRQIRDSKELFQLLSKSQKEALTAEEKEKVRRQLLDIVKSIPAFVLIALPGAFLTLPILLKILPNSALPSAFSDDD